MEYLQSGIYVQWDTERPFVDSFPRQSSNFCLLGVEWFLKLEILKCTKNTYKVLVSLTQTPSRTTKLNTTFKVATTILIERPNMVLFHVSSDSVSVNTTSALVFNKLVSNEAVRVKISESPDYWRIICLLISNEPLSLQQGTKHTVLLSDKCVQASLEIPPDMVRLSEDFSNLLEKEMYPDVKLRCRGQIINVHRSVLAARSDVFNAMFRNKMLESETNSIDVPDLELPVLNSLLKFVYSGKIQDLSEDSTSSLYEASDKYAMHSLKRACSDWMVGNLTEENCINYLIIADTHSDLDFRSAVISFIINHPKVLKSSLWLTFSKEHSDLAVEVFQSFADLTVK